MLKVPNARRPSIGEPSRHRAYDRRRRDQESKRFYNSRAWQRARAEQLCKVPYCEECMKEDMLTEATVVHHAVAIRSNRELCLNSENMVSLCHSCHSRLHACQPCA